MQRINSNIPEFNDINQYAQHSNGALPHCPIQIPPYTYSMHQQMLQPLGQRPVLLSTAQSSIASPSGSLSEFSYPVRIPASSNMGIRSLVNDDTMYRCNIIAQLQGDYEVETPDGQDQVSVIVPSIADDVEPYAIVRRICSNGEALADQIIHQETGWFTLCSVDGAIEAVMMKGSNMKCSVRWEDIGGKAATVWRRKGDVTFNLVQVDSLGTSRRNSVSTIASSMRSSSARSNLIGVSETLSPSTGSSSVSPPISVPNSIPPGIHYQNYISPVGPMMFNPSCTSYASNGNPSPCGNMSPNANNSTVGGYTYPNQTYGGSDAPNSPTSMQSAAGSVKDIPCTEQQQALVELIKAHCLRKPYLLKRLVHWGMGSTATRRFSPTDADIQSKGRLWVTAFPAEEGDIEMSLQENLEDIKGAYGEVQDGVYKQPEPQVSEPGVQHRLLKSPGGQWRIEAQDLGSGEWQLCAQELPDGRWLDMKNNHKEILVHIIPMSKILQKLGDDGDAQAASIQEVEKSMEFLFKSCNQKKLNSKLKGRNLRHNIDNLKVKLEKQYSLCFAVQVASVADSIAKEFEALR